MTSFWFFFNKKSFLCVTVLLWKLTIKCAKIEKFGAEWAKYRVKWEINDIKGIKLK